MAKNTLWRNPWIVTTGGSILGVIGIRIIDFIAGTTILTSILNLIQRIFIVIGKFFVIKFEVSLWFLFLLPIIVIGVIVLIIWIVTSSNKGNDNTVFQQASFLDYREEVFGEVLYRWEYFKNFSNKFEITNISHYCPDCKCSIVYDRCPICKKSFYNRIKSDYEIDALIRHRIEHKFTRQ